MSNLFDKAFYAIFPRRCELCGEVVSVNEARCEACRELNVIKGDACKECGKGVELCDCKAKKQPKQDYDAIIAPFMYDGSLVDGIHKFKFGDYPELADAYADEMVKCIQERYKNLTFDAITYVPLSKKRESRRGYNQSLLLAQKISETLNAPLEHTFYRAYDISPQRNKSARKRRVDIFGAFDLNSNIEVGNKIYLVVDDVKTTGATLSECAAVLKSYGAKTVYAVALAVR